MANDQSTGDYFDPDLFRYTTLKIDYYDSEKIVREIETTQPEVKVLAFDSRQHCPHFLTSEEFYLVIQSKDNIFFVDVGLNEENEVVDESLFIQKLGNIDKHLIIQCGTLSSTRVFVKQPGEEVHILDLNSHDPNEQVREDELINRLKNKDTFGLALMINVVKQGWHGKFHDKPGHHRTLTNASFNIEKVLGSRDTLVRSFQQPEIRIVDYCTLMDYAVFHNDFLTVRLLSSHTWELLAPKHEKLSTLEIAAKYSSPQILATLLGVDLPISFGSIKLPKHSASLLDPNNYHGNNTPLLTAVKAGKYDNVDFFIRCGVDVNVYDDDGKTCLWYVVSAGKWEMAKCLVERGARITSLNSDQNIALLEYILGFKLTIDHSIDIRAMLYNTLRVNNADLLIFLFDKWHADYKNNPVMTQNLDECLCKVYENLKLKNMPLLMEVQFVAESKIIQSRFFIEWSSVNQKEVAASLDDVIKRIDMVVRDIQDIKFEYSGENAKDADARFVLMARFIGQNINVLKRQLKSTYSKLPWEEVKFCLAIFIASMKSKDFNICKLVLGKERIISHLHNFAMKLDKEKSCLTKQDINSKFPKHGTEDLSYFVKELYKDYQLIKDVYSLQRIEGYVKVALGVKLDERRYVAKLVIERTLQVIGESLKSTTESPNLSDEVHKMLLSSASTNLKDTITVLRDFLSHADMLKSKLELDDSKYLTSYEKVQNDLIKIGRDIAFIIYKKKSHAINMYLAENHNLYDLQQVENMVDCLNVADLEEMELALTNTGELDKIKELVCKLFNEVKNITEEEKGFFARIHEIIDSQGSRVKSVHDSLIIGIHALKKVSQHIRSNDNIGIIKNAYQNFVTLLEEVKHPFEDLNRIECLLQSVYQSMQQRNQDIGLQKVMFTAAKVVDIYKLGEVRAQGIDNYKEQFEKRVTDILRKAEDKIDRILVDMNNYISNEADKMSFEEVTRKKRKSYVAKRDFGVFIDMLIAGTNLLEEPERQMYRDSLNLLELKKGRLEELQEEFDKCNWPKCKILVTNIKNSYQTLLDSVKNSIEEGKRDMSKCFKEFVNSLGFTKKSDLKSVLLESIDNLFKRNEQLQNYFDNRLTMLKLLLPDDDCVLSVRKWKQDKELQIAIEMLVLDMTEILDNAAIFADNRLFMDRYSPVLMGKTLRNYLAHGDALIDILPFEPSVAILSNAHRFVKEGRTLVTNEKYLIGQRIVEDHLELSDRHRASHDLINLQNEMFIAAKEGDLGLILNCIAQGADVKACDVNNGTVVHFAVQGSQKRNVGVVKYCIDQKLFIDCENDCWQSPIHVAATHGSVHVMRYLLEDLHLRVNDVDRKGVFLLNMAARYGHNDVVKTLLRNGAKVTATTRAYWSPLFDAVQFGHRQVFLILLDTFLEKQAIVDIVDSSGWTPLHCAVVLGHNDIVINLLNSGAQVNAASVDQQMTPLHLAVQLGCKVIVETLLDYNANVHQETDKKRTALHLTANNSNPEVVKLLLERNANVNATDEEGFTALHWAAHAGNKEVVHALLHCKTMVDARIHDQSTPLHIAARYGCKEVIDELLDHNADINAKNKNGEVPLHLAARCGLTNDVVIALLERGANTNASDMNKRTPLHHAAENGNTKIICALLDKSAIADARDICGRTPLHLACVEGNNEAVALLSRHGTVDAVDLDGWTPLHLAICFSRFYVLVTLLKSGADINRKDDNDMPPLHVALFFGRDEAAMTLLKNGADVNVGNLSVVTLLHFAAWLGNKDIASYLLKRKANADVADIYMMPPLPYSMQGQIFLLEMIMILSFIMLQTAEMLKSCK